MRTVPVDWETDDDSIGYDTDDTVSVTSGWMSSELDDDSEAESTDVATDNGSDADSDAGSDAGSDCTAIPDEAFDFEPIESDLNDPELSSRPGPVDLGENDEIIHNTASWPHVWRHVSLSSAGPYGFVSHGQERPASVAAYDAEDYVREVDVQPHLGGQCRLARRNNRLRRLPNADALRLFVQYTSDGPTVHAAGEVSTCPALAMISPTDVIVHGMSLVFDDIPLEIWMPDLTRQLQRLVLLIEPGPTGDQWRRWATTNMPMEMANAGIVATLRALPDLDLAIVFNSQPGEVWDSGCNEVVINAVGHLLANFSGSAAIVNLESVTMFPTLGRELQEAYLLHLERMKYTLNKTIFERSPVGKPPRYMSMRAWLTLMRETTRSNQFWRTSRVTDWDLRDVWEGMKPYVRRYYIHEAARLAIEARHQPRDMVNEASAPSAGSPEEGDLYVQPAEADPAEVAAEPETTPPAPSDPDRGPIVQRGFEPVPSGGEPETCRSEPASQGEQPDPSLPPDLRKTATAPTIPVDNVQRSVVSPPSWQPVVVDDSHLKDGVELLVPTHQASNPEDHAVEQGQQASFQARAT